MKVARAESEKERGKKERAGERAGTAREEKQRFGWRDSVPIQMHEDRGET